MLLLIGLIITVVGVIYSFIKPYKGLLFIIATKSLLDATWSVRPGGISFTMLMGFFVPVLFYIFIYKNPMKWRIEKKWRNLYGIYFMAVSFAFIFYPLYYHSFFNAFGTFMKTMNGVAGVLMLPILFNTKDRFKDLLLALLISGVFPIFVGVYEAVTGANINYHSTIGGEFVRNVGFYHDIVTVRFYCAQTIIAGFLFLSYYKLKWLYKISILSMIFLSVLVIFFGYTKAGYGIMISWFTLFAIIKRSKIMIGSSLVLIFIALVFFKSDVYHAIETTYAKEMDYQEGQLQDEKMVFAGRLYVWEDYMNMWKGFDVFGQFMGTGRPNNAHNEFLRILITNGIMGLIFYSIFLFSILYYLFRKFLTRNTPLVFSAILIVVMYLIDCIGVVPGIYPSYQWFTFGMIGLAFTRLNYELIPIEKQKRVKS